MWVWLVKNPAVAVAGVLGVACAVLFGLERYRAARLDALQAEVQVHQANFDTAMEANRQLAGSLDKLKSAHDALIETVRADTSSIERAANEVRTEAAAIRANSGRLRASREEIYRATPSCAELVKIDLAAACPALAGSLRDQADRQNSIESPGDSGSRSDSVTF